ncbi:hypothetical protein [Actinacidiphila sp. ITFR-21]|uniref:hypothetical protein n=1 Tax=Actinacidiphila sp. ITFR-21 TaxID=3075199 RepID=UPI00288BF019|nr:hypothetical protein [Streptomyces sp. ITFR-21]WNI18428.1 hypothetical protein RLT57_24785 [Streptomyces sp. ITFR-21]
MTEVPSRRSPGTPCWASLMAERAERAQDFHGALFGWEFAPGPPQLGRYTLAPPDPRSRPPAHAPPTPPDPAVRGAAVFPAGRRRTPVLPATADL